MCRKRQRGEAGQFLRTMAHEELGLSEESFPNRLVAAVSATISTALGAIEAVITYVLGAAFRVVT